MTSVHNTEESCELESSSLNFDLKDSKDKCLTRSDDSAMINERKIKCAERNLNTSKQASKCYNRGCANEAKMHFETASDQIKIKDENLDGVNENCKLPTLKTQDGRDQDEDENMDDVNENCKLPTLKTQDGHHQDQDEHENLDDFNENCKLPMLKTKTQDGHDQDPDEDKNWRGALGKYRATSSNGRRSERTLNNVIDSLMVDFQREKKYQCSICKRLFGYFGMFQKHMRTHVDATDYSCCTCFKAFIELEELFAHFSSVHPEFEKEFCKRKQFSCSQCEKRFKSACHLTNHMRTHTGEKPYSCDVCDANFVELSGLNRHRRRSHVGLGRQEYENQFSFTCDECPKRFESKQRLVLHRENHYKTFKCDKCEQGFLTERALENHMKRMHYVVRDQTNAWGNGKSKYTCAWCSRRFKCSTHLENHERIHSGVRPFVCDICDRTFAEVGGLRRHNRLMHVKKNPVSTRTDRPFKCEDCGKCFKDFALLKSHSSIHIIDKPYQCDICSVRFVKSKEVVKHKLLQHSDITDVSKIKSNNRNKQGGNQKENDSLNTPLKDVKVESDLGGSNSCKQSISKSTNNISSSSDQKLSVISGATGELKTHANILKNNIKDDESIRNDKEYMCGLCGESFDDIHDRYLHMKTHENVDTSDDVSMRLHQRVLQNKQDSSTENDDDDDSSEDQHQGTSTWESCRLPTKDPSRVSERRVQSNSNVGDGPVQLNNDDSLEGYSDDLYGFTGIVQPTKERPFQCDHCHKTFIRAVHLHNHIMTHTGERPFKCDLCGKGFIESSKLARHHKTHDKKTVSSRSLSDVPDDVKCPNNDKTLQPQNKTQTDGDKSTEPVDDPQAMDFDSSFIKLAQKRKKFLFCHGCKQTYMHTENLALHIKYNSDGGPFQCTQCLTKYSLKCELDKHLRKHMMSKITKGQKPQRQKLFPCELCGSDKVFTSRANLKAHMRVHTGERPYVCDVAVCGMAFKQQCQKTRHMRTHTGEREFVCEFCGKDYADPATLKGHIRIHTGDKRYKCEVCGKAFTESCKLTRHRRVHTGEKPYKCSFCGNLFTSSGNLRDHERIHTGEMPYHCDVCQRGFAHPSKLLYHKRTHIPDIDSIAM